jgi:nicotinamidase-related amidase
VSAGTSRAGSLHGNVPDRSRVVLLLIDVINDLDFPNNVALLRQAPSLGMNIAALKKRCREKNIPAVYVNDNRGKWRSDFANVLAHCVERNCPGRTMVEKLIPDAEDYIVLKPKHSAFHATPLDTILTYLGARTVILAGLTTGACVLLTAGEIYIRDIKLAVPSDCVAALRKTDQHKALALMRTNFQADTTASKHLNLKKLLRQ